MPDTSVMGEALLEIVAPDSSRRSLNRFLFEHAEIGGYATMFFGILGRDGRLEFINAGHPSPLLLRHGEIAEPFTERSFPIGLILGDHAFMFEAKFMLAESLPFNARDDSKTILLPSGDHTGLSPRTEQRGRFWAAVNFVYAQPIYDEELITDHGIAARKTG